MAQDPTTTRQRRSRCRRSRPSRSRTSSPRSSQELAGDLQIKLDGPVEQQVQQAMRELDVTDTNSIIFFGSKAQQQLTHDLRHDAGERAHQGHGPGRQRAERDGREAARDRHRRRRPDRSARLLRPAVRRQERGPEVSRQVRGRTRPDRHDHDRARAAQDQDADRHRQARQAVRRQSRLFPDAGGLHRRRPRQAQGTRRAGRSRPWPRRSRARTTCSRRRSCATCAPPATISSAGSTICC